MSNTDTDHPTDVLPPQPDTEGPPTEQLGESDLEAQEPAAESQAAEPPPAEPQAEAPADPPRPPWRWTNGVTSVLLAIALPVGGFLGGVLTQQKWGAPPVAAEPAAPTTGTLKAITDTSMIVETAPGTTITIRIAGTTKIQRPTTPAGLTVGQPVTVQGSLAPDGTMTATSVSAS